MNSYVPLWCKSHYSFLEGASHPEELISRASTLGLPALALTDRHGVYGLPRAYEACRSLSARVRLLCGAQVNVLSREALIRKGVETPLYREHEQDASQIFVDELQKKLCRRTANSSLSCGDTLVLLAQDQEGWKNLCSLLTLGASRADKGECLLGALDVAHAARNLVAVWVGTHEHEGLGMLKSEGGLWRDAFGDRFYIGLARHASLKGQADLRRLQELAKFLGSPVVATREVLYHEPQRQRLQDVLTCLRHRCTLREAGSLLRSSSDFTLCDAHSMASLYADLPAAVMRTFEIAERCTFDLGGLSYSYPDEPLPEGQTSSNRLYELALAGAHKRYASEDWSAVEALLNKELTVIVELGYGGYFLTMYEIVEFCRSRGILCQGRGSAANSIVCFSLGITAVDPYKLDLLFERFLSKERAEPPDIDLDIMHERREEVVAWVYERYGRERAAMVCQVVRFRPRMAVREVGKVLEIEAPVIERLARLAGSYGSSLDEETWTLAGLSTEVPSYALLLDLVNEILDCPHHLSIHPGGFLLGKEPVCHLVPIEKARRQGRTVIQWDKYDVESMGLFKIDLLGLGALSHLDRIFRLTRITRGLDLTLETLPIDDPETYRMLGKGDSVGVFQVESRAQMSLLPMMQPERFYDLVVQIAIIRPGPITGGMVHPYLRRRRGEEAISYAHASLEPILAKTLGIPLFQEQVMRLAVVAADYTPGEADQLRRDMAAWRSHGKLEQHRLRLISGMLAKGIAPDFADQVFRQIQGFGEYGFPESHAASFALLSYASSYLRCHYLPEFTCALLNCLPMGFYSASTLVEDAKRHGLEIRPFSVEESMWDCTLEASSEKGHPWALRLGLKFIKGLSLTDVQAIVAGRPYASARALALDTGLGRRALELLAMSGALESYGKGRRAELWSVDDHLQAKAMPLLASWDASMVSVEAFPRLGADEEIDWDYEASGLSGRGHPMSCLRSILKVQGYVGAREVLSFKHGTWIRVVAMVICRQRPVTAKGTVFLTLEDESGFINVIVWPKVFKKYREVVRLANLMMVEGRVEKGRGTTHLVAYRISRPDLRSKVEVACRSFY